MTIRTQPIGPFPRYQRILATTTVIALTFGAGLLMTTVSLDDGGTTTTSSTTPHSIEPQSFGPNDVRSNTIHDPETIRPGAANPQAGHVPNLPLDDVELRRGPLQNR